MFLHVLFIFPETARKPLEEVDEIFDYSKPGSIKYLGTPAWKTHVSKRNRLERDEIDDEEMVGVRASHDDSPHRVEAY